MLKSADVNPSQLPTVRRAGTGPERASGTTASAPLALGRYHLQRRLGAGAFGTVWMARDERLERDVAVKIVPRERIVSGRFEREARAAARLSHPGIVTLYEAAMDDDGAYLVSELVRGATLGRMLEQGRLSDRDIVTIAIALCDALSHAHAQGVVHRDVKPSNILIPRRPSSRSNPAKLTDFGVARVVGGDSLTVTGDVVGTAAYMAPEQAEGREAGAAADLYSLALVTYEALTGVNPVRTGTSAIRARRLGAHLPPLRRQRRELPRELGTSIDQALRPRARERGTVEELRGALESSLAQVGDAPGVVTSPWPRSAAGNGQVRAADAAARGREDSAPPAEPAPAERDSAPPAARPLPWPARALAATAAAATHRLACRQPARAAGDRAGGCRRDRLAPGARSPANRLDRAGARDGRHGRHPRTPRRRAGAADRRAAAGAADAALGAGLAAAGRGAGTRISRARWRLAGGRGTGVELPVAPGGAWAAAGTCGWSWQARWPLPTCTTADRREFRPRMSGRRR